MPRKPINVVLAEALRYYMGDKWSNLALAKKSGVSESTIRNYLTPSKRTAGASGKEPSAKLTELAKLADVLGIEVADLVTEATPQQRTEELRRRAAAFYAQHGRLPEWAPGPAVTETEVRAELARSVGKPSGAPRPVPSRTDESTHADASAGHALERTGADQAQ